MILKIKPHNYWTKSRCQKEALKYKTRNEFCVKSNSAYVKSLREDWINEICQHMLRMGSLKKRCVYVYEFPDNHAYIGLTHDLIERDARRKLKEGDQVTKYIKISNLKPIIKQLTDYIPVEEAASLEIYFIKYYREHNWKVLNIAKGGVIGGNRLIWTKEKCQEESLKFKTRSEFKKKNDSAYKSAKRNGWFDEIISHMK